MIIPVSPPPTVQNRAKLNLAESLTTSGDGINNFHHPPREFNIKHDLRSNPQFVNEDSHPSDHSLANMSPPEPESLHLKSRGQSSLEFKSCKWHPTL